MLRYLEEAGYHSDTDGIEHTRMLDGSFFKPEIDIYSLSSRASGLPIARLWSEIRHSREEDG